MTYPPASIPPSHPQVSKGNVTKTSNMSGPSKKPTRSSKRLMKKEEKGCIQASHAQNNPKEDGLSSGKVSCEASSYGEIPQNPQETSGMTFCTVFPSCSPNYPMSESADERERMLGMSGKANKAGSNADEQEEVEDMARKKGGFEGYRLQFRDTQASTERDSIEKLAAGTREGTESPQLQPYNKLSWLEGEEVTPASAEENGRTVHAEEEGETAEPAGGGNASTEHDGKEPSSTGHATGGRLQNVNHGGRKVEHKRITEIHSAGVSTLATKLNHEESYQRVAGTSQVLENQIKKGGREVQVSEGREEPAERGEQLVTKPEERPSTQRFLEEDFSTLLCQKVSFGNQENGKGSLNFYKEGHLSKAGETMENGPKMKKSTC